MGLRWLVAVSYTHLRAHETPEYLVCRLLLVYINNFFFLMIRRPPRSTLDRSSAASDVYKRQASGHSRNVRNHQNIWAFVGWLLSLIHISELTRLLSISFVVFCLYI